jgi:hypothetical protein
MTHLFGYANIVLDAAVVLSHVQFLMKGFGYTKLKRSMIDIGKNNVLIFAKCLKMYSSFRICI